MERVRRVGLLRGAEQGDDEPDRTAERDLARMRQLADDSRAAGYLDPVSGLYVLASSYLRSRDFDLLSGLFDLGLFGGFVLLWVDRMTLRARSKSTRPSDSAMST